ncbi:MAG: ParB N-terminal domain-containing protein [Hyphomonadaceae bacterium]|nr:ParB N-terminal domain-containing protein [Hyphomonadaceae bacterium]
MTQAIATADEHAVQTGVVLIPLNKLKKSPKNARKTPHAKAEIEALAASIHAKGMLQNLVVEPELDDGGGRTSFYLVQIGEGRRLAQVLRVKRKQIQDSEPIRCVIDTANDPLEISLDENVTRSPMSVMDEVEAFASLVDGGMNAGDIARRFGCTVRLVEQRLALARLSPKIRAAYRKGDINLDVARAFAINDDHAAQERVFRQFAKPITHAASVRNALTAGRIPAHDRLARFVGAEAYEAAGGVLVRDLFEPDIVFFDNGDLLQRLASEKTDAMRACLAEEGWGWVEVQLGHGQVEGCAGERLHPISRKLKPAERKNVEALEARIAELDEKLQEADDDNPLWAERDEVEAKLDAVQEATRSYDKKLVPHAGAVVSVDRDGRPVITRGLIKRSDLKAITKLQQAEAKPVAEDDGVESNSDEPQTVESAGPRLTKALVERLTEARTRGLRAALAQNTHVALGLMVYVLMRQSADRAAVPGVAITSRPIGFDDDDAFEQARSAFAERAPEEEATLLASCLEQSVEQSLEALAVFMSETIDLTHGGLLREDKRLQRMGDCLAAALDLDMRRHWEAGEDFFEAAPKSLAIAALEAAPSVTSLGKEERRGMIAAFGKMKKADLARTAAQALKDTGWLPDLLVTPTREGAFAVTARGERALAESDAAAA